MSDSVPTKTVRVYTCNKHPHWTLESAAPVMAASLKQTCPHCREEFIVANIGVADCRIEKRDVETH